MSHGVQLADLFDCLPSEKAQREFLHELSVIRGLCLKIIEGKQLVAKNGAARIGVAHLSDRSALSL